LQRCYYAMALLYDISTHGCSFCQYKLEWLHNLFTTRSKKPVRSYLYCFVKVGKENPMLRISRLIDTHRYLCNARTKTHTFTFYIHHINIMYLYAYKLVFSLALLSNLTLVKAKSFLCTFIYPSILHCMLVNVYWCIAHLPRAHLALYVLFHFYIKLCVRKLFIVVGAANI